MDNANWDGAEIHTPVDCLISRFQTPLHSFIHPNSRQDEQVKHAHWRQYTASLDRRSGA